jgi:hypothetical protein
VLRLKLQLALVVVALLGVTATSAVAAPPTSGRSGACTGADNNAVTVVIDYQGLGGGTAVYCASNLPAGATGLDALTAIGVSYQGTTRDGLSFVCRVNGRPSSSEKITLPGGQTYQETCASTPPSTAYWSYWWAKQSGSWGYTSQGAGQRQVVFGSYEGWSFSLGGGIGQAPAPRHSPVAWQTPKPATTAAQTSAPPPPKNTPATPQTPAGTSRNPSPTAPATSTTRPSNTSTPASPTPQEDPTSTDSPPVQTEPSVASTTPATPDKEDTNTPHERTSPWALIGSITLVSFLLLSGVGYVIYRRWTM